MKIGIFPAMSVNKDVSQAIKAFQKELVSLIALEEKEYLSSSSRQTAATPYVKPRRKLSL